KPCNDCKDCKADQADGEENVKRVFSVVIVLGRLSDFCGRDPSTHDQRSKGIFGKQIRWPTSSRNCGRTARSEKTSLGQRYVRRLVPGMKRHCGRRHPKYGTCRERDSLLNLGPIFAVPALG